MSEFKSVPRYGQHMANSLIAQQLMEERDEARKESFHRLNRYVEMTVAYHDALHMIDELVYQLEGHCPMPCCDEEDL